MKSVAILALVLGVTASAAEAATIVSFSENTSGAVAASSASSSLGTGENDITGTLTNDAPFDAGIAGFGFSLGAGNLAGLAGTPDAITTPSGANVVFQDGELGNVPQFSAVEADSGFLSDANLGGGSPNDAQPLGLAVAALDNMPSLEFLIPRSLAGLSEEEIASGLFVGFEGVGPNVELSDVETPGEGGDTPLSQPEPASMLLLGSGLVYLARRRFKSGRI